MIYHRVIPVLLFDDGAIYRSQEFRWHCRLGDPFEQLARYKQWDVDEIIYLDMHRTQGGKRLIEFLPEIARNCFAPLSVGGGIRSLDDIERHFRAGADRVVINSVAIDEPDFITAASHQFGSQAIIVSIDAKRRADGSYEVVTNSGRSATGRGVVDWALEAARRGAGEIFLNSIDRDGTGAGYDIALVRSVASKLHIPVIACGGVGSFEDFAAGIAEAGAGSVAAANIFCFKELSYLAAKDALAAKGIAVRRSEVVDKRRWG